MSTHPNGHSGRSYLDNHDEQNHPYAGNESQGFNNETNDHNTDHDTISERLNENHDIPEAQQKYLNGYETYQSAANNDFDGQDWESDGLDDDLNEEDEEDDFLQGNQGDLSIDRNI